MIGLIAHSEKADARDVTLALIAELKKQNMEFALEAQTAHMVGESTDLDEPGLAALCDLLIVLGGDGTILRVVHKLGENLRPIFGINIGSLGFLTCVGPTEIEHAVESIARKSYILSHRSLLAAELHTSAGAKILFHGLNDVVVSRGERSQLVKIHVTIDGEPLTDYNADGLVVATPTGSTAYSLAAGGPILLPGSGAFVITPICPHVLTNRSLVVSNTSRIEIGLLVPDQFVFVTVDGESFHALHMNDTLRISLSERKLPLAMLPERSFSKVLRQKLKWVGSNV